MYAIINAKTGWNSAWVEDENGDGPEPGRGVMLLFEFQLDAAKWLVDKGFKDDIIIPVNVRAADAEFDGEIFPAKKPTGNQKQEA